ncbi:MAG: ABC transporter ATP-binding protein [Paracoccaceae bacterium]
MLLNMRDIRKAFGATQVLRGVDLTLARGQTLALTGESGSGKSTLLHLAAGLDAPDGGTVHVDGTDVGALDEGGRARLRRETVGVIFQAFNLIPSLDVAANVAFQARLSGRHDPARDAALMERLGIADQAAKYPEALSGGQQQRVAIARTLSARPALVLADEPTGNLDEDTADAVLSALADLVTDAGAGLLMVTHSDRLAGRMQSRVHLARGRIAPAGAQAA